MKLVLTLVLTAVMAAHAGLGCCAHHEHVGQEAVAVCHDHACHGHPADTDSDSDQSTDPESCDEESCVFLSQESSSCIALDCLATVTPLVAVADHFSNQLSAGHRAVETDVLHPAGPALHLWQCVLVI